MDLNKKMKKYLASLKAILENNNEAVAYTYEGLKSSISMNPGALPENIKKCQAYFEQKIPIDYEHFWETYNGGVLFKFEDLAGFELFSDSELIKANSFERNNLGEEWDNSIILFARCLGDAEYLGFRYPKQEIVFCIMDELPSTWHTIDNSFDSFLTKLIESKGEKYWLRG
jgi:hypothetical protein